MFDIKEQYFRSFINLFDKYISVKTALTLFHKFGSIHLGANTLWESKSEWSRFIDGVVGKQSPPPV